MALFDTLQVTTELVSAGIERNQAESIAKSIAKVRRYRDKRLFGFETRTNTCRNERWLLCYQTRNV